MSFERQEYNSDSSESEESGEYRDSVENVEGSAPPADEQEDQWDYHEEELSFNAGISTPTQPSPNINRRFTVFSPDPTWPPRNLSLETDFNFLESVDILSTREEPVFEEEEHSDADSDTADIVMPPKPKPTKEEALSRFDRSLRNWNINVTRLKNRGAAVPTSKIDDMRTKRDDLEMKADHFIMRLP